MKEKKESECEGFLGEEKENRHYQHTVETAPRNKVQQNAGSGAWNVLLASIQDMQW